MSKGGNRLVAAGSARVSSRKENIAALCEESRRLEAAGEFERAAELFAGRWANVGDRPLTAGLDRQATAALLLRTAALTGHLGSSKKLDGAQERAKDLLTEARAVFYELGNEVGVFECDAVLAVCYWRESAYNESYDLAAGVLVACPRPACVACLTAAVIAGHALWKLEKTDEGLKLLRPMESAFEAEATHGLHASYRNTLALLYKQAGQVNGALLEYTKCSEQLELAGNFRYLARLENNLASLLSERGQHAEAHAHVERALRIARESGDHGYTGQVKDTLANILIREGQYPQAVEEAREAVRILGEGDEYGIQIEGLTTLGTALARVGDLSESLLTFARAREMAFTHLGTKAAGEIAKRLIGENLAGLVREAGMTFDEAVLLFEASLISPALKESAGHVTAASLRMGMSSQRLGAMLKGRHRALAERGERAEIKPRQRSYTGPKKRGKKGKVVKLSDS